MQKWIVSLQPHIPNNIIISEALALVHAGYCATEVWLKYSLTTAEFGSNEPIVSARSWGQICEVDVGFMAS